jgi:two-component system NtrC family response regulator
VQAKILLVEDEESIREQMCWALQSDYQVLTAAYEDEALNIFLKERPPVVTLDLSLNREHPDDLGGMRLLEQILSEEPSTRVIVVTGNNDETNALRAVRLGAFDYYCKPIRLEDLKVTIQRAVHIYRLHQRLHQRESVTDDTFHGIIGRSKSMQEIFRLVERVARSDISVLISGESGTGKEVVAHAIHQQSPRKNNPFVTVNCAAIPENLLESELFGHEKGAFTGAHATKPGKFEMAHNGTLFLDEIGDLAPGLQVKLLRFLQERQIERVGGTQPIELDVRILAATKRDLKQEMETHRFREDLYYRLKVVPVDIPPLRKRKEDIIPLALYFLKKFCDEQRKPLAGLSTEAEAALLMHPWTGNVRELENLISRAVVLSPHAILRPSDLGFVMDRIPTDVNLKLAKQAIERDFVKTALQRNRGIVSRAARELGISRVNLYELVEKYKIQIQEFKFPRVEGKRQIKVGEVS